MKIQIIKEVECFFLIKNKIKTRSIFFDTQQFFVTWALQNLMTGEVAEWLKAHAWKACMRETVSGVRIPFSPHKLVLLQKSYIFNP